MSEKKTRVTVSRADFVRVVIVDRDKYETVEDAAAELGMTPGSLRQRITRERKEYPTSFVGVPKFTTANGPHKASQDEMDAIIASLKAERLESETESESA